MAASASQLKARFAEFVLVDDAVVTEWLSVAARQMNPDRWGTKFNDGQMFLAGHFLKLGVASASPSTARGPVVSESVGGVSRSYAAVGVVNGTSSSLSSTFYGQQYLDLKRGLFRSPLVA